METRREFAFQPINIRRSKRGVEVFVYGETNTISFGVQPQRSFESIAISRVINDCIAAKANGNRRPGYVRSLKLYLQSFAKGRESKPISGFTVEVLEDWFSHRTETPSSRRSNIGRLSSLFSYAWRRGFIKENPCRRLERIRVDAKPPRILTVLEARTILYYMSKHGRRRWRLPQIVLGLFAGVRPVETTRLYWRDIDMVKGLVRIDASASKVRQRRIVPLSANAIAWLKLCTPNNKPLGAKRWKWIQDLYRGTAIQWDKDLLRHTCASYWLEREQDCGRVARWLGNSPDILLRHYTELVSHEDMLAFWSLTP